MGCVLDLAVGILLLCGPDAPLVHVIGAALYPPSRRSPCLLCPRLIPSSGLWLVAFQTFFVSFFLSCCKAVARAC
jgi:hypothetical protein